jgi:hypothetical protein
MPNKLPEWVHQLEISLFRHALVFAFGARPNRNEPLRLRSGTCCIVDLGEGPFLLTAKHVLEEALACIERDPRCHCLLGSLEATVNSDGVYASHHLDLATTRITPQLATKLSRDCEFVRPATWPPPTLTKGDGIIFVGFPGAWREARSWNEIDCGGRTSLGLVHSAGDESFVCHLDPEYLEVTQPAWDAATYSDEMGGMSGGPAFLVRNEQGQLLAPQLCGVVREGAGSEVAPGHRMIYFTSLTTLRPDGSFSPTPLPPG